MSRLTQRLQRLEQQTHTRALSMAWPEVHAATERLRSHAVTMLKALLHNQEPPRRDETQARAESAVVDRWCRAQGTYIDRKGARARLEATLTTIAARYAADPPG